MPGKSSEAPHLEIRSPDGRLLASINVVIPPERRNGSVERKPEPAPDSGPIKGPATGKPVSASQQGKIAGGTSSNASASSQPAEGEKMSEAQQRFLFRLLAARGINGDKAYEHLKKLFQTERLKDVSKLEASNAIERLLEEAKGGGRHAA